MLYFSVLDVDGRNLVDPFYIGRHSHDVDEAGLYYTSLVIAYQSW